MYIYMYIMYFFKLRVFSWFVYSFVGSGEDRKYLVSEDDLMFNLLGFYIYMYVDVYVF